MPSGCAWETAVGQRWEIPCGQRLRVHRGVEHKWGLPPQAGAHESSTLGSQLAVDAPALAVDDELVAEGLDDEESFDCDESDEEESFDDAVATELEVLLRESVA